VGLSAKQRQDMHNALSRFNREAERIIKQFYDSLPHAAPDIIYHYTNNIGLKGILETGRLWLTDIFQLNDPSELKHGFDIALAALGSKVASATPTRKQFGQLIADCFKRTGIQGSAQFFVCAFARAAMTSANGVPTRTMGAGTH
jgi:hypothetical protein